MSNLIPALVFTSVACLVFLPMYGFFVMGALAIRRARERDLFGEEPVLQGLKLRSAQKVFQNPDRYLLSGQIGMYLCAFLAGASVWRIRSLVLRIAEGKGNDFFVQLASYKVAFAAGSTFLCLLVAVGFVQFLKAVAFESPEKTLGLLSGPLIVFAWCVSPLVFVLRAFLSPIHRRFGLVPPAERDYVLSVEDISRIAEHSSQAGFIEEDDHELIQGVIEFSGAVVREVMTPRSDIIAVKVSSSLEEVRNVFQEEGISRLVVIGDELDDVKGILLAKDLIPYVGDGAALDNIESLLRSAITVSGEMQLDDLLKVFRREASHFALVIDEHGGLTGVVTVEDLIEEIVGDIFDEYDDPEEEHHREEAQGDVVADGGMLVAELNETFRFKFPEMDEYDTVAGMLLHQLGRVPQVGDSVVIDDVELRAEEVLQNRVTRIRISRVGSGSGSDGLEDD